MKYLLLLGLTLTRLLKLSIVLLIALLVLPLGTKYVTNLDKYTHIEKALQIEKQIRVPSIETMKKYIPVKFAGVDYSRTVLIFILLLGITLLNDVINKFRSVRAYYVRKGDLDELMSNRNISEDSKYITQLNDKLSKIKGTTRRKDRNRLLKEYTAITKQLDSMCKELTFLAVDVVDSTGMKKDADKKIMEYAFNQYDEFIEKHLNKKGALKYAMTPDGVMSCFGSADKAVAAAKSLVMGLDEFNKNIENLDRDFTIRSGMNSGRVYFDEAVKMETMVDEVIDIAGHMQKKADPSTIKVSEHVVKMLCNKCEFEETDEVIDGTKGYIWKKPV